jgi:hypothetical protein
MLFVDAGDPTLLGIAAIIAALGGIVSTVLGTRKARRDERAKNEEECIERLRTARQEAEGLAEELHQRKMREAGL